MIINNKISAVDNYPFSGLDSTQKKCNFVAKL